jgi:methionine-rich copper-binding protein CopC
MRALPWALSIATVVGFVPGIARAHDEDVVADPAPGEHVVGVERIEIDFVTDVEAPALRVVGPTGTAVEGSIRVEARRIAVLVAAAPLDVPGTYVVEYFARADDGHAIAGDYEFTVDDEPAPTPGTPLLIGIPIALGALCAGGACLLTIRRRRGTAPA